MLEDRQDHRIRELPTSATRKPRRRCGNGRKARRLKGLICRENVPGDPFLTVEVLYQLSYVGTAAES
jgi:hypothetical protein